MLSLQKSLKRTPTQVGVSMDYVLTVFLKKRKKKKQRKKNERFCARRKSHENASLNNVLSCAVFWGVVSRSQKRYYYRNVTTGVAQWTYPEVDVTGGTEEMEICTTPPPAEEEPSIIGM